MASISLRDLWSALAPTVSVFGMFGMSVACIPAPLPSDDGHTTTTYGGSNSNTSFDDGVPNDETGDGSPGDPTDTGPTGPSTSTGPSTTGPGTTTGPSDTGPDFLDLPNPDGLPDGSTCTSDEECSSSNCYVIPFLGGFCGQCNEDADCFGGGCTAPNPFGGTAPFCNMGEAGGGCESDEVCSGDLSCAIVLDLLGLITISTCGSCVDDSECGNQICAPIVVLDEFGGQRACIEPYSLPQDSYCDLESNGAAVCESGVCSVVDIMGLAEIGACGACNVDAECNGGVCVAGELILDAGTLLGSTCQ